MSHEALGKIIHLAYHPIKGAHRVEAQSARITRDGLEGDREYMIVRETPNEDGIHKFVTQRDKRHDDDEPQGFALLTQVHPKITPETLELSWRGEDRLAMPRENGHGEIPVQVWGDVVRAVDQGPEASEWLSDHLGARLKLVRAAGSFKRGARQNYATNENGLRFQDGYPILWFLQSSLDELSEKAGKLIPWTLFRPNIVVEGAPARTEHSVAAGLFGDVPFFNPKPCDRCTVTNVDQDTGEVEVGRALKPLSAYKKWRKQEGGAGIIFGENALPLSEGEVHVGDEVELVERRNPPLEYR